MITEIVIETKYDGFFDTMSDTVYEILNPVIYLNQSFARFSNLSDNRPYVGGVFLVLLKEFR